MVSTKRETVKILFKSIVTRLANDGSIEFPARLRQVVQDELYDLLGNHILTDQDLHERTLQKIGASAEAVQDAQLADSPQYRTARSIVRKGFGDDELNGFYFQKTLKSLADQMAAYFMRSSHVDDVFETDEELGRQIVEEIKRFNPDRAH
jgi:hypothetical protein